MGNQLLTPPELEPAKTRPTEDEPELLIEADGSMWSSLISNLREAFSSSKQPPLQLSSQPVDVVDPTQQEPVWKTLTSSIQDLFFPKKLPPLELTSKPIPWIDGGQDAARFFFFFFEAPAASYLKMSPIRWRSSAARFRAGWPLPRTF